MLDSQSRLAIILHISDLHLCRSRYFDTRRVLEPLFREVSEQSDWLPDLICCTGDIAFSGKANEYELAEAFFNELVSVAGVEKKQLYLVPGNHDVDLSKLNDRQRKVREALETLNYREFLRKSNSFFDDERSLKAFLTKFGGYQKFVGTFLGRRFDENEAYYFAEIITTKSGLRVGIVGLNSAWLFEGRGKQSEYGCQLLGVRSLQKAFEKLKSLETRRAADLKVVMFHHPIEWLWEHERSRVREFLRENADLVLQGQQDNPDQQFYDIGIGAKRALVLQEGPAYDGSHYPNRVEFIRCEVSEKKKVAEVKSITFDDKSELWVLDTATFARQKRQDSHGYFTLREAEPRQVELEFDIEAIRRFLEKTAILAGKKVVSVSGKGEGERKFIVKEGLRGVVTPADLESDKIIRARISVEYPQAVCVSEESEERRLPSDLEFFIDPLDGTINYWKGLPYYSISIACRRGNQTIVGVVYDLGRDMLYSGIRDGGIFITRSPSKRRVPIPARLPAKAVSDTSKLSQSLIITGWPYDEWREATRNLSYVGKVAKMAQDVRRLGAVSLDLCLVAIGLADGCWETGIGGLWDILAGALLVREAGGICEIFIEAETERVGVIATNGLIHRQLYDIVKNQFANYERFESFVSSTDSMV